METITTETVHEGPRQWQVWCDECQDLWRRVDGDPVEYLTERKAEHGRKLHVMFDHKD